MLDLKDDPELIAVYEKHHQNVWPEVERRIRESGIVKMEIYRLANRLVMALETEDHFSFEKKRKIDGQDPKVQEWEELMSQFQQPLPWAMGEEKWVLMESIYKLD